MQKKNTFMIIFMIGLFVLSVSIFPVQANDTAQVDDTVQAEDAQVAAVGSHQFTANYYQAYIYDDHDGWIRGAGDWYFRLYGAGAWTGYASYSRDGPGYANFADRSKSWYITGSTSFRCFAGEYDEGWDYTSTLTVSVAFGAPYNTWRSGSYKLGDVNHYYQYYIRNLSPSVGSISGPSSGNVGSTLTFYTSGSDPEGDSLTYQWYINGVYVTTSGPTLIRYFSTAGTYSIYVRAKDALGTYGSWSGAKTVVISAHPSRVEIWTNKVSYFKGETLTAYVQLFNPGSAKSVKVNVWFGLPGGGTYMYETYYLSLPASYTSPVYTWKKVTIPYSAASGTYSVKAEMRYASTNALIDSDTYTFYIS